jgi:Cdc6-like AAA superfamily ATPase
MAIKSGESMKPKSSADWLTLEWEIARLFSGAPVQEEDLFAGRSAEVGRIMDAVFERSRHVVLYGERGVGKTSIANVFPKRLNANLQTVIAARVQADPSDTFASLWAKVFDEFVDVAKRIGRYDLAPIDNSLEIISPDQVRREFQKCNANCLPIVIIDEYDKLTDPDARLLTANVIKYLYDYSVDVTIILVGVAEDIASLIADHESVDRAISQIKMNRMSDGELNEVIDTRISKTPLKLEADARWTIVTLSRGLPYFTQMLTKHAATHAARSKSLSIKIDDVERAMDLFIRDSEQKLQTAYAAATDSNQSDNRFREVLLACALAKCGPDGFFTPTEVIEPLSAISKKTQTHAHFQRHLLEFISQGRRAILTRRGTGRQFRYRFSDPMMPPYAIIKGISEGLIDPVSRKRLLEQEQPTLPNV